MLVESHPLIRRALRFLMLPYCYFKLIDWKECTKSRYQVAKDLLYVFFRLKYYPDNYAPCRFWEKDRSIWSYYYGSSYHSYARHKLRKEVQSYEHQVIFNDKSVSEQLCKGMDVQMPTSYGFIDPAGDCRGMVETIFRDTGLNELIIKPILGHAGRGIILAVNRADGIVIKTKRSECNLAEYEFKDKSIIQEIVTQNSAIAEISNASLNTIRLISLLTRSQEVIILSASMRFGVGNAFVDNWSAGGIAVGVDYSNGTLMETAYDKHGGQYYEHPDSKVVFNNYKIPCWDDVIKIAHKVQEACPFYKLIGVDVAISKNGPVLIEINANPDIVFQEQTAGPLLQDKRILSEFAKYDLLVNDYQKSLLKNIRADNTDISPVA